MMKEDSQKYWRCPLSPFEISDFKITPLTSSRALASEGWNMQHCVATYAEHCATGLYHVFSIRNSINQRIATLGLQLSHDLWRVDQCLGFRNVQVTFRIDKRDDVNGKHMESHEPTDLHYLAHEVARLLNRTMQDRWPWGNWEHAIRMCRYIEGLH